MNAPLRPGNLSHGRIRVRVRGRVQGVGFRPFVWALARRFHLAGFVRNDSDGVLIEAEGERLPEFMAALRAEPPPLSRIDTLEAVSLPLRQSISFEILESRKDAHIATEIGPDVAVCGQCLAEIFTPESRRYLYPFTTCTHCGPRYTVTRALPYDRPQTALAPFPLCAPCAEEYVAPADRRFHAETTACADCGPAMSMNPGEIWRRISEGEIVAVKGVGGFHLVCDALNEGAVAKLRLRKQREAKPFAVMALNLLSAQQLAAIDAASEAALMSPQRPIVIVPARGGHVLAPSISCGLPSLGIMLPAAPIHYLLFHAAMGCPAGLDWLNEPCSAIFVATSANPHDEPLVITGVEARERLDGIADAIADHNRAIIIRADDSVVRVIDGAPAFLRRARGFTPEPVDLGFEAPPVIAFGAHLKSTLCLTRGREAFLSQHIGDLNTVAARRFLQETAAHLAAILDVAPALAAHDLHPDFASTHAARGTGLRVRPVQHHHAHIAAVVAEHRISAPILGVALDGYGMGEDGGAWGGELLRVDRAVSVRVGHLRPIPVPGGDRAAQEPWRMAASALHLLGRTHEIEHRFSHAQRSWLAQLLATGSVPSSSSMGRWFDAACGLLGVMPVCAYEGQAPTTLEGMVRSPAILDGGWHIEGGSLDFLPLMRALIDAGQREGADLVHGTFVAGLSAWIVQAARSQGLQQVALGGGCFQNRVLTEGLKRALAASGLAVLMPRALPANDGGISLGQALVASRAIVGG